MKKPTTQEKITSAQGLFKSGTLSWWMPRLLAGGVGLVLLTAGLIKAMDIGLFVRQIRGYDIISNYVLLTLTARGLITFECTLGVGLLVFYRPRLILPLTAMLLLFFVGANSWAWLTGATTDCGCFGAWLKRTPGEGAVESLILLAVTLLAWKGYRQAQVPQPRYKVWTITIACVIGLTLPVAFSFPLLRISQTQSKVFEMEFGNLQVQGLDQIDLEAGSYLFVLMDTDCLHCEEAVEDLNLLARETDLPPVIALCINSESKRRRFAEEFQAVFAIGQINDQAFFRLLADGDIPRTILVSDRRVQQVWDQTIPDSDLIKTEP